VFESINNAANELNWGPDAPVANIESLSVVDEGNDQFSVVEIEPDPSGIFITELATFNEDWQAAGYACFLEYFCDDHISVDRHDSALLNNILQH